jgi:CheY-like chemotaxis protein
MALEMIIDSHKKQKPYTVVYIDNNMPVMTGIEVMQKTREFERDNNLKPLYAVSTSGDYLDTKKVNVFDEYIGKPFRVDEIRKVLHH